MFAARISGSDDSAPKDAKHDSTIDTIMSISLDVK